MRRSSGVLLHITSLPGRYGIGALGKQARQFADFCRQAGLSWWQVLPVGPTGYGNSPYQSDSVFAGNPQLIDLEELTAQGLLTRKECGAPDWGKQKDRVDFERIKAEKPKLLRLAFSRARVQQELWEKVERFCRQEESWLSDYALYLAIKEEQGGSPWQQWPQELRLRYPQALAKARERLREQTEYHSFVQYLFYTQWQSLREYCNRKGVRLIGDIPIYVAPDSCDTWVNTRLFEYDENCQPLRVAGCPPDYFSKTGQLWGNPLYNWSAMKADGFGWWIRRVEGAATRVDALRLDHFRAFESYWAVPAGAKTAKEGAWEKGPGMDLLRVLTGWFPQITYIAEDLGILTDAVHQLREESGLPGMKVLEFAFSGPDNAYLPHHYAPHCICYTGTHDNVTTEGWRTNASPEDVAYACRYLRCKPEDLTEAMICACLASVSDMAIIPLADWLHLGSEARINTPSTQGANWQWRLGSPMPGSLAAHIAQLTALYERTPCGE